VGLDVNDNNVNINLNDNIDNNGSALEWPILLQGLFPMSQSQSLDPSLIPISFIVDKHRRLSEPFYTSAPPHYILMAPKLRHVLGAEQFDRELLEDIFKDVEFMQRVTKMGRLNTLSGKIMACLFYEPSTRTRFSFEAAMRRLGGNVLTTENAQEFSSAAKGESLADTIRIVSGYADVIVMRHKEEGSSALAAKYSSVPIINAGDGMGEHPTQALLDLFTIKQKLGTIDGISVALVGDLKHGRTVHSLAHLLAKFKNVKIYLVAPKVCPMKPEVTDWLKTQGVELVETDDLNAVLPLVDCVYMTRVQKERFASMEEYEQAKGLC